MNKTTNSKAPKFSKVVKISREEWEMIHRDDCHNERPDDRCPVCIWERNQD